MVEEQIEIRKGFWERLKGERGKPVVIRPLNLLMGAFAVLAFVLVVLLTFYILRNISLLQADPCRLCRDAGFVCAKAFGG